MARRSSRRPFRARLPFAPKPDPLFRWRGTGVSRLEGFADAVFAFTITLLVVALEVPRDFDDLLKVFQGFPAFAATFAILVWFWSVHYLFFRRYGLEDTWTRILNNLVLLLVVFLAYPLKFLFSTAFATVLGFGEGMTGVDSIERTSQIYLIYGAGLGAVWLVYFLMYLHAWRQRRVLQLTPAEEILTRGSLWVPLLNMLICLLSVGLALFERFTWQPGVVYGLCGPAMAINGWWYGTKAARIAKQTSSAAYIA